MIKIAVQILLAGVFAGAALSASAKPLSPLTSTARAVSTHTPFETGECGVCHDRRGEQQRSWTIARSHRALCLDCHDQITETRSHAAAGSCTSCHNPHNAARQMLLVKPPTRLSQR